MSIEKLKTCAAALHGLTPEGRHINHRYGTAEEKAELKRVADTETDSAVRMVRREQLARFIVVSADHAHKHAATLERKNASAGALLKTLDLLDKPGVRKGRPGVIAEADARKYLIKTFREIRHAIAAGGAPDVDALSKTVAEHLGTTNVSAVKSALASEVSAFAAEHEAAKAELGANHVFHEDIGFHDASLQG